MPATKKPTKKLGRPPLAKPSNRVKITIDVTPETYRELTAKRTREGVSIGRLVDAAFPAVKK